MAEPRRPGIQASRVGGPGPDIPKVRWGRDQLIRKTRKLVEDIVRAYRGDFSFIYILDTDPHPIEYGVISQELLWTNLKAFAKATGTEIPACLNIGMGPILTEYVLSLPRGDSDYVYISEQKSGELIIKATRQGADDYLIEGNIDGGLKTLEHTTGSQAKVNTHAALTGNTHGLGPTAVFESTAGAQTKVNAGIATHAADTSTHGAAVVADDSGKGARVYNNANISIPNGSWTALTFNSEQYDQDNIHSTASNTSRLTCKTAGKYMITGALDFAVGSGQRMFGLKLNGSTFIAISSKDATTTYGTSESISALYDLAVNDYIELMVFQNSGAALNVNYGSAYSPYFAMQRISG